MKAPMRQVMIGQLRKALNQLESPHSDEEIQINIGDHELVFQPEDLRQEVESEDYL